MRSVVVTVGCLLVFLGVAAAEDPPQPITPAAVAEQVLQAVHAKDQDALAALARQAQPDAWTVADELCQRGEREAATAFAKATQGKRADALTKYVSAWKKPAEAERVRSAVTAANEAFGKRDWKAALEALAAVKEAHDAVSFVLVDWARGVALQALNRMAEATDAFEAAAQRAERIGWTARAGEAFTQAGMAAWRAAQLERARTAWGAALRVQEARGDERAIGNALSNVAIVHARMGDQKAALGFLERAKEIQVRTGDRAGLATTLMNIAISQQLLGDLRGAVATFEEALALDREKANRPGMIRTLVNLGNALTLLGDYANGLARYREALPLAEALGDQHLIAKVHQFMANTQRRMGAYAEALQSIEKTLDLLRPLGRPDSVAQAQMDLANVLTDVGDRERALALQKEALVYLRKIGEVPKIATLLNNLGSSYAHLKRFDEARAYLREAVQMYERAKDRQGLLRASINLGAILRSKDEAEEALTHYRRAVELAKGMGKSDDEAIALGGIGRVLEKLGQHEEALTHLDRAVAGLEKAGHSEALTRTLYGRARVHYARSDYAAAIADLQQAAQTGAALAARLAGEGGAVARELNLEHFELGALAAGKAGDAAALAWFVERSRAGTLLESLANREVLSRAAEPPARRAEFDMARTAEAAAVAAYRKAAKAGRLADARAAGKALDVARANLERAADRLDRAVQAGVTMEAPAHLDVPAIGALLAPGDAYVGYSLTTVGSLALVVDAKAARIVELGSKTEIEAAWDAAAVGLQEPGADLALAPLRALVVAPLGLAKSVRRVFVSPQGVLGVVPFAALLPGRDIVYLPSATTYGLLRGSAHERGTGVLAAGDPDYGGQPDAGHVLRPRAGVLTRLTPLPETRAEAKAVGDVVLVGQEANEGAVRAALSSRKRWRAVHFACHGLLDTDRQAFSALALTPSAEDDGFLTVLEIMRMSVPADLVALSACDTGRGRVFHVEGVLGLTRAFMQAGAPRVLVSLWKVDDHATRALMIRFYELWGSGDDAQGMDAAAALRAAQEHIRAHPDHPAWAHPYYWAAWVLWGLP